MIIKATSHTIKTIWMVILFIFLIFFALIGTLIYGISLDSITLPKVKIEQLYIKLDKKIILTAEHVRIDAQTQKDTSLEESALVIKYFPYLNQLFKTIVIQKLSYDNETFSLSYEDNAFNVESNHLSANVQLTPTDTHSFDVTLSKVHLKDYELSLEGKASIDLQRQQYAFEGSVEAFGILGVAIVDIRDDLLSYHFQADHFTNKELSALMNFISPKAELDPLAKAWIHENIVGASYQLHFVEGKYNLTTEDYFPNDIRGRVTLRDANVTFEPSVPAAHIDEIGILFENDRLLFDVKEATYENKQVEHVDVYIYNLLAKGTGIVVDLNATSQLDASIHKILHAFNIRIPIVQTSGTTQSHVRLAIKFLPYDLNATGEFRIEPSHFLLDGMPMYSHYGTVRLDNTLVYLDNANIRYKDLFDINATGTYTTKEDRFEGAIDINALSIDFGETHLLDIRNLSDQEAFLHSDTQGVHIALPTFKSHLTFDTGKNLFRFNDLEPLKPFSPLMDSFGLSSGIATVFTKDFEHFDANVSVQKLSTPFIENNTSVTALDIALSTNTHILDASTLDNKLSLHFDKEITVYINDMNLSIPQKEDTLETPIPITVHGKNSSLIIEESTKSILSDAYTIRLKGSDFHIKSTKAKTDFEVDKTSKHFSLHSSSMDDTFANALIGATYMNEGSFSLQMEGKSSKANQGSFILQNTYIKELKFFNNLMATINAIPSLIVFTDPNFNQKGYFVKNGYIEFDQEGECFTIKDMLLRGSSADIVGNGRLNFDDNTLELDLQIRTLKTFSSIIDMIPLVGGVILGEDKKISTRITVTGTTDDPKVETHLVTDTLMSPLNIIKRTLELPLELFK